MTNNIFDFRNAIYEFGLSPHNNIEPGKLYRVPGVEKRSNNTSGWYKLFYDGLGGCFGDWSTGRCGSWHVKNNKRLSSAEKKNFIYQIAKAKLQAEENLRLKQTVAAKKARSIWYMSTHVSKMHPYLIRKGINSGCARFYKQSLVLPIKNFNGKITSLQFIKPDGQKILLLGGQKKGCFIHVSGNKSDFSKVIICEGWSTGCTLAANDPKAYVLAAIDAGNLKFVAISARIKWPNAELIIAGDDDRLTMTNVGATKAKAAAIASGGLLALPQWPEGAPETLTDFNDLSTWLARGDK